MSIRQFYLKTRHSMFIQFVSIYKSESTLDFCAYVSTCTCICEDKSSFRLQSQFARNSALESICD